MALKGWFLKERYCFFTHAKSNGIPKEGFFNQFIEILNYLKAQATSNSWKFKTNYIFKSFLIFV